MFKTPFLIVSCLLLLSLSFGFSACKAPKNAVTSVNNHPEEKPQNAAVVKRDSAVATISRTPCYGKCPTYTMIIYPNGAVWFEGQRNVTKVGIYTKNIGKEAVNAFIDSFEKADVWSMKDSYPPVATDLPMTNLTFKHNGQYKAIKGTFNAPESLLGLVEYLYNMADDDTGWLKTGDLPMQK